MRASLLSTTAICTSLAKWSYAWTAQDHIPHGQGRHRPADAHRAALELIVDGTGDAKTIAQLALGRVS